MYKFVGTIYVNSRDFCVHIENVYSNTSSVKQALCVIVLFGLEISSNSASPRYRERIDIETRKQLTWTQNFYLCLKKDRPWNKYTINLATT
jgi:hypothetical protein